jgi:hypoxanthine phosphoribosyltransferase
MASVHGCTVSGLFATVTEAIRQFTCFRVYNKLIVPLPIMTTTIHDLQFKPMISREQIQDRVGDIGAALTTQLGDKCPLFISILSGAFVFASDLIRSFNTPCEVGFVKLASYQGTRSSGDVQTVMGLQNDLSGRHLVVVEDIVDTGRTLHFFLDHLRQQGPASICTVALLCKPDALQFEVPIDYVGFEIPDAFVVGYGLDYDGLGRNLPEILVKA